MYTAAVVHILYGSDDGVWDCCLERETAHEISPPQPILLQSTFTGTDDAYDRM